MLSTSVIVAVSTAYLGTTLTFAVGWLVLRKIIRISRQRRITSLSDFVSARYGNSVLLGALVTVVAVVGLIPYIALQLKAVSNTFTILRQYPALTSPAQLGHPPVVQDTGLYVALQHGERVRHGFQLQRDVR